MSALTQADWNYSPSACKWTRKQVLGHLIDSAANNHQRFIRAQYEDVPHISYDQNRWNALHRYHELDSTQLIEFWTLYNHHLLHVIKAIPADTLQRTCDTGSGQAYTLDFLVDDYVSHMEHHLRQIIL